MSSVTPGGFIEEAEETNSFRKRVTLRTGEHWLISRWAQFCGAGSNQDPCVVNKKVPLSQQLNTDCYSGKPSSIICATVVACY